MMRGGGKAMKPKKNAWWHGYETEENAWWWNGYEEDEKRW
jgi:hypothetical protein